MTSLKIYLLAERLLRSQTKALTELHEELLYKALKEKFERKKNGPLREEHSDSKTYKQDIKKDTTELNKEENTIIETNEVESKVSNDNKTNSELKDRTSSSDAKVTPNLKEGGLS